MRVIAGICKGRRLLGPRGDSIRPALDQVKEAIFNILGEMGGAQVLDLFAGTGSVGVEALSRGAAHCLFVDTSAEACRLIHKNLEVCRLTAVAQCWQLPAGRAIGQIRKEINAGRREMFDLIFCDPPYQRRWVSRTLKKLEEASLLKPSGYLVVEHHPKEPIPELGGFLLTDQRKYGQTLVSFLKARHTA